MTKSAESRTKGQGEEIMLGIIAAILIVCWLLGLFAFHITTGLIHIVLVVGIIFLILHFVLGRRVSA
ncbi:MAG: lmo0937 family membrane protein, partial [Candidatus Acidiferrum sp.]